MTSFYTRVEADPDLLVGYKALQDAVILFRRGGQLGRARAALALLERFQAELTQLGVRSAEVADELIRGRIDATAVRPPTSGRMRAAVISRPLATAFPSGAFGIADVDELNKSGRDRLGPKKIAYWMAQEFGSTAAIGRVVPGYFEPGGAKPDGSQFRVHPFFQQVGPPAPRGTPAMVIENPIHARHFVRDGARDALAYHQRERAQIVSRAVKDMAVL